MPEPRPEWLYGPSAAISAKSDAPSLPAAQPVLKVELTGVPISEVLTLIYSDILQAPYVMSPEAYADRRAINIRIEAPQDDARRQAKRYIESLGYMAENLDGVDRIVPAKAAEVVNAEWIYTPLNRDAAYLQGQLSGATTGSLTAAGDSLVFWGPEADIGRMKSIAAALDTRQEEVEVNAIVFEVQNSGKDGSALELAAQLLSGSNLLQFDIGAASPVASPDQAFRGLGGGQTGISFTVGGGLTAIANILDQDSRFRIVTRPTLRATNGSTARFTSGSQVPVLGSVSYSEGGAPIQSIEYRDSGVLFTITPQIRENSISLKVGQEISSFAETTTGINATPTLSKRSVDTELNLADGQTVLLGGLIQSNESTSEKGLFGLPMGSQQSTSTSEIIVILQVRKTGSNPSQHSRELVNTVDASLQNYGPMDGVPSLNFVNQSFDRLGQQPEMISAPENVENEEKQEYLLDRWSRCGLAGTFQKC